MQITSNRDSFYGKLLGNPSASKGGFARASKLSPTKRTQIAKKAAQARWSKDEEQRASTESIDPNPTLSINPDLLTPASFTKHLKFGA